MESRLKRLSKLQNKKWKSWAEISKNKYICRLLVREVAGVVELVDTLDLGSSAARCGSSSLPARTKLLLTSYSFLQVVFYSLHHPLGGPKLLSDPLFV